MLLFDQDLERFPSLTVSKLEPIVMIGGEAELYDKVESMLQLSDKTYKILPYSEYVPQYEKQKTKGIFNYSWFKKLRRKLPWVIVAAFKADIIQSFETWDTIQDSIISKVTKIQKEIGHRPIQLHILIIHDGESYDKQETKRLAEGRITIIRRQLDTSAKHCHLISMDEDKKSIKDSFLFQVATSSFSFLKEKIAYYKKNKKKLSTNLGSIRIPLKIGILLDQLHDEINSFENYYESYKNLIKIMSAPSVESVSFFELFTIADYLFYRIVSIYSKSNKYNEAQEFFSSHIKSFSHRLAPQSLSFIQYSWLSCQFRTYISILGDAIPQEGLSNIYYTMISFVKKRLDFLLNCELSNAIEETTPKKKKTCWGEMEDENRYISEEMGVKINLLKQNKDLLFEKTLKLIEISKKYFVNEREKKRINYLMFLQGEMLIQQKDIAAKEIYQNLYEKYEKEESYIKFRIIEKLLEVAEIEGNDTDKEKYSKILLNPKYQLNNNYRNKIYSSHQLLKSTKPEFLRIETGFNLLSCMKGQNVIVKASISNGLVDRVKIEKIEIKLSNDDIVMSNNIIIGGNSTVYLSLPYEIPTSDNLNSISILKVKYFLDNNTETEEFEIENPSIITIENTSKNIKLTLEHKPIYYLGQFLPIYFSVLIQDKSVKEIQVNLSCSATYINLAGWYTVRDQTFKRTGDSFNIPKTYQNISNLMKDILYIHLEREGTVSIHLSLSINRQIVAFKKTTLTVLKPFNVNTSYSSDELIPQSIKSKSNFYTASIDSNINIYTKLENLIKDSIFIESITLKVKSENKEILDCDIHSSINNKELLKTKESINFLIRIKPSQAEEEWKNNLYINWRFNDESSIISTKYKLDPIAIVRLPFTLSFSKSVITQIVHPVSPTYGEPFQLSIEITNNTSRPQDVIVSIEQDPSFLLSGLSITKRIIQVHQTEVVGYILLPTDCGEHKIGKISILSVRYNEELITSEMIPSLLILP